ncbi:hypothetical protein INT48_008349, partial [Thamnidium elegans]
MSEITETQESRSTQKTVPERVPGTTILPLARIKRVIKEDKDVSLINAEATFCIANYLWNILLQKLFQKPRKIKERQSGTVKEIEQFEFLEDVIPTTMTLKAAIEK